MFEVSEASLGTTLGERGDVDSASSEGPDRRSPIRKYDARRALRLCLCVRCLLASVLQAASSFPSGAQAPHSQNGIFEKYKHKPLRTRLLKDVVDAQSHRRRPRAGCGLCAARPTSTGPPRTRPRRRSRSSPGPCPRRRLSPIFAPASTGVTPRAPRRAGTGRRPRPR